MLFEEALAQALASMTHCIRDLAARDGGGCLLEWALPRVAAGIVRCALAPAGYVDVCGLLEWGNCGV